MVRQSPVAPMTRTRRVAPSPAGAARPATEPDQALDESNSKSDAPPTVIHAELGPIIRSKIQPPVLRESTLTRQRLIDNLLEATQRRLTLVIAEAGYGKTTLMADFAVQTGIRTLWFRLDPTDGDIVTWTNHIIAAVREFEPAFGQATLDLMAHLPAGGPPRSAFASSVIGELGQLEPVRTVLVLDDFHSVDQSEEANDFVGRLTRDAPPWLAVVVSARRRPTLELGRLAASDDVAELATEDLRFSIEETGELFAEHYRTPLEDDVLRDLDSRVNGWAASLQLFHGSVRGRPVGDARALAKALSGATKPIYDFLAEEVLANVSAEVELFLMRSSLLDRISPELVIPLFEEEVAPSLDEIRTWIDEADRLMLLSRSRGSSESRHLHPLLRDFLSKLLRQREGDAAIRRLHLRVAAALEDTQPLVAARHYIDAGDGQAAMRCLGSSVMLMIGSGQWGVASDLIGRIQGVPMEPAVAAIEARRLLQEGLIDEASAALDSVSVAEASAAVRGAVRSARLSLAWRLGDAHAMEATLDEIENDDETPQVVRDIAQLFVDTSSHNPRPIPFGLLARRLEDMSKSFAASGHHFYSAIAVHNATFTYLIAGQFENALLAGRRALDAFASLPFFAVEQLSTHATLAAAHMELGDEEGAEAHTREALRTGEEYADVPANIGFLAYVTGRREDATELLVRARLAASQGHSDLAGNMLMEAAVAVSEMDQRPERAIPQLSTPVETPLDLGLSISRRVLLSELLLAAGREEEALRESSDAAVSAESVGAGPALARANVVRALAANDVAAARVAIAQAARAGSMALLEVAPLVVRALDVLGQVPPELSESIRAFPRRWLPLVRRVLESGNTRAGHLAAAILDEHGTLEDVGLLRAFAKTYARRGPGRALGKKLARRVSPPLLIRDLGRTELIVGHRGTLVTEMRRKPASVLMYLVTRPGFAANREQVIDELWPESDPIGAINNLNQSLYFLRREIDPWYEDDVSVDYVHFEGDLVWLDSELVAAQSLSFTEAARSRADRSLPSLIDLVTEYRARFAPEFEYEDWSMSWRSRLHSTFLDLSNFVIELCARDSNYPTARNVAAHVLDVDDSATDVEKRLIWLYYRLGLVSAARAQYEHLAEVERADGFDPTPFEQVVTGLLPKAD